MIQVLTRVGAKNNMKKRIARIVLWLLFAYIVVSASLELMKGMGY